MKVILNKCFGGFDVSEEAYELYAKKKGVNIFKYELAPDLNYRKTKRSGICIYHFTQDFGDKINRNDVDWNKYFSLGTEHREDPILIEIVEELGEKASGAFGELVVVDIPDGMDYVIDEYDGIETLHENVEVW